MRLSKALLITAKDVTIFRKKPVIIYSLVMFEILVAIVLPVILHRVATQAPRSGLVLPDLITAFSVWFVIGAAVLPVGIASYSLVGEKLQHSLEPLLAAPVSDHEILVGKALAALLPTFAATYVGAVIFMALVDAFTQGTLHYRVYPNATIAVILLVLVPLVSLFSVGVNVLISSRANDVRTAQQVGAVIPALPLGAVYVLTEIGVISLSVPTLWVIAAALAVLDVLTIYATMRTFRRDQILTAWA
jgi:ABC-2 type transport system permease protein